MWGAAGIVAGLLAASPSEVRPAPAAAAAAAAGAPGGAAIGAIVGSFDRPLPPSDPRFQFTLACAIERLDVQTGKRRVIRKPRGLYDCPHGPRLSPDGARVLFRARTTTTSEASELRLVGADGKRERTLARISADDDNVVYAWSPDGTLIAIGATLGYARWVLIDPDGGRLWSLPACVPEIGPGVFQWAADGGGLLVVERGRGERPFVPVRCDLAGRRSAIGASAAGVDAYADTFALAPDASALLRAGRNSGTENAVVTVGTGARRTIWEGREVAHPFWSPDGRWVGALVPPAPHTVPELTLVDVRSGAVKTLGTPQALDLSWWTPPPAPGGAAAAAADSRALVRAALGAGEALPRPLAVDLAGGPPLDTETAIATLAAAHRSQRAYQGARLGRAHFAEIRDHDQTLEMLTEMAFQAEDWPLAIKAAERTAAVLSPLGARYRGVDLEETPVPEGTEEKLVRLAAAYDWLGVSYAKTGDRTRALVALETSDATLRAHGIRLLIDVARTSYHLACAYALAGRHDEALARLRTALEKDSSYRESARTDPDLAALRRRPDFEDLLR